MPTYIKTGFWEKARKGYKEWLNLDQLITNIVTPLIPPAPTYKVYTALLSQTGENAPTAIVLENTLGGNIVWTRIDEGVYIGTLSNSFIENKTGVIINNTAYASDNQITTVDVLTTSTVNIQTSRTTEGVFGLKDSCMYNNLIEIRVYN
jgi:hypothetical protein